MEEGGGGRSRKLGGAPLLMTLAEGETQENESDCQSVPFRLEPSINHREQSRGAGLEWRAQDLTLGP